MPLRVLLGTFVILLVLAVIKRPFRNKARLRELVNHMIIALAAYYGTFAVLTFFGYEQNKSMSAALIMVVVVMLVVNLFFRKA